MSGKWKRCRLVRERAVFARFLAALVVGSFCATAPLAATAQTTPAYSVTKEPFPWQPLGSGATIITPALGDSEKKSVTLPFPIRYFGSNFTTIWIVANFYVTFTDQNVSSRPDSGWGNWMQTGNSSSVRYNMLTPFWADAICNANAVRYQTLGTAPNRQFAVEWDCGAYDANGRAQVQIWFTEGSDTIEFRYGAVTGAWWGGAAAMGIKSPDGNTRIQVPNAAGNFCNDTCTSADAPQHTVVRFARDEDLQVSAVQAPGVAYGGVPIRVEAQVRNVGGKTADGFAVELYLSADTTLQKTGPAADILLETVQGPFSLLPTEEVTVVANPPLPPSTPEGIWYVLVEADPDGVTLDAGRGNNVAASGAISVEVPAADLLVAAIAPPTEPQLDGTVRFSWTLQNRGNAPAIDVPYIVIASRNDYNSAWDVVLASGTATIDALTSLDIDEVAPWPADYFAGAYHIGISIDPDDTIFEPDVTNNIRLSDETVLIGADEVVVATRELPEAQVGSNYCILLSAAGGDGTYVWTLEAGELPRGLALEEERAGIDLEEPPLATMLCGIPERLGNYAFTLEVSSAGLTARQDYEVEVMPNGMALTAAGQALPDAIALQDYRAELLAVGGKAPYAWSIVEGALPEGITLDKTGRLRGVPALDGGFEFVAQVEDSTSATDRIRLTLIVAPPTRLTCMTKTLPSMGLGQTYDLQLRAAGAQAPYQWTTVESRRLPSAIDDGQGYPGSEPPGLSLHTAGQVKGTPAKAGRYLWLVEVRGAGSTLADSCTITFDVTYEQGITITTSMLADAYVGVPYEAELDAMGATGEVVWSLAGEGDLPGDIGLGENGLLAGTFPLEALEGRSSRVFTFNVLARDEQNRTGIAPLSLRLHAVAPEAPGPDDGGNGKGGDDGGGCQSAGADPGLIALGIALGLAALRRRPG